MAWLTIDPEELFSYLAEVELPRRRTGEFGSFAAEIIRFGSFIGREIECHERLERTMDRARAHIDREEGKGIAVGSGRIILAGTLTGSKGRFTRSWHAPAGGAWGCLIHANTLLPKSAMLLSFAVGIAACEAVAGVAHDTPTLRWVNDVLLQGAKVGGFLIESHTGPRWGEQFHLVGFGINVNNCRFPVDLEKSAVSIAQNIGGTVDLKAFYLNFLAKLVWNVGLLYFVEARQPDWAERAEDDEHFRHPVIGRWQDLSDTVGRRVVFGYDVLTKPQYQGVVTGVVADGGLEITLDDGLRITEHSGEVRYLD